jgi:hypothetical protein
MYRAIRESHAHPMSIERLDAGDGGAFVRHGSGGTGSGASGSWIRSEFAVSSSW